MNRYFISHLAVLACALFALTGLAPPGRAQIGLQNQIEAAVSGVIRERILADLGNLKFEDSKNWGKKSRIATGKPKIVPKGIMSKIEPGYVMVNDGQWERSWVQLENARDEFDVRIRDVRVNPGTKELRFQIYVRAYIRAWAQTCVYKKGVKLIDVDGRGRARVHLTINLRVALADRNQLITWAPEQVNLRVSDVVVDQLGRFGGESARLLGSAIRRILQQWAPNKERAAFEKATSSIERAFSGNRKVKLDLHNILSKLR